MAFPKYESYKDSRISWVKEIPSTWRIERAKWLFQKMERPVRPEDEVVTAFRDGEVTLRKNRREDGFTNALQEHGYQGVRKGDLVIHAMDAFAGAIGVSDSDGKSTPVYSVCTPRGEFYVNNNYYAYLLRYMAQSGFIQSLAKGIRERSTDFRFNDFANLFLPIPSPEEQDTIVDFLNSKIAEIDEAIAKKQRLIELLQEQKAILINQAVTKGLNPKAPMRDSGIEWIGEIPEHWEMKKIKHLAGQFMYGTSVDCNTDEFGTPVLRIPNIETGRVTLDDLKYVNLSKEEENRYLVHPGDILIVRTNGNPKLVGRSALVTDICKCLFASYLIKITPLKNVLPEFLSITLNSSSTREGLTLNARTSAGNYNLNTQGIGDIYVAYPPKDEQVQITKFINSESNKIDLVLEKTLLSIEKLKEIYSILIANAITGKIKI